MSRAFREPLPTTVFTLKIKEQPQHSMQFIPQVLRSLISVALSASAPRRRMPNSRSREPREAPLIYSPSLLPPPLLQPVRRSTFHQTAISMYPVVQENLLATATPLRPTDLSSPGTSASAPPRRMRRFQ